jgi:hypothetical protein
MHSISRQLVETVNNDKCWGPHRQKSFAGVAGRYIMVQTFVIISYYQKQNKSTGKHTHKCFKTG